MVPTFEMSAQKQGCLQFGLSVIMSSRKTSWRSVREKYHIPFKAFVLAGC
jgi:hypothetical protein